jgi:cellulose synthase/poly-beta-1,6-N-acetylglucosamine synthase-like glycosyltransferase
VTEPRVAATVVIPTIGRSEMLRTVLRALCAQTLGPDAYEVIVSVDGPAERVPALVEEIRPSYRHRVVQGPRRGRASACNAGLEIATGDIIVLLDDDMEPVPHFLDAHIEAHRGASRRAVVGAAPVRKMPDDSPVAEYVAAKFARHLQALATPDHCWTLRDFYTGNFSIRRDTLAEVGHFDGNFGLYGNEDLELFWRLRRASVEVTFCAAALAWQRYTKSLESFARDNWEKGRTAVQLAGKFPEAFPELKLSSYRSGSLPMRVARRASVAVGRACPWCSVVVVTAARLFERGALPGRQKMYELVANYLYWMGAFAALEENRATGCGLIGMP